jgi:enoyl-CoA hydratase
VLLQFPPFQFPKKGASVNYETILYQVDERIARITINRPDKLNALSNLTIIELDAAIEDAADDESVHVIIITGSGDKAFVAGADIGEINTLNPVEAHDFATAGQLLMQKIHALGKPVIAAINGYALGGGCELAMACTLRIAADKAKLGLPEISLGIMPGFGGTQRLLRLAGPGAALEMALTGAQIGAEKAAALGLVNEVVAADELQARVDKLAGRLAAAAPVAVRSIIRAINLGGETTLERGLEYEAQLFALCCSTDDMQEGTSAFLEKRKPEFSGH